MATIKKISETPNWFKPELYRTSRFTDFFPDFVSPNKPMIWFGEDRKESLKSPSYKGFNYIDDQAENNFGKVKKPGTGTCFFIYDSTFHNITETIKGNSNTASYWATATDDSIAYNIAQQYLSVFKSYYNINMVNGEFWHSLGTYEERLGFARVVKQLGILFKQNNPNVLIGWWANGIYQINVGFQYEFSGFGRTAEQLKQDYSNPQQANTFLPSFGFESWDISEIHGYATDATNLNIELYSFFQTHEASRAFNNNKLHITTYWEQQELIEPQISLYRDIPNKGIVQISIKAARTAISSFNNGLAHAVCLNGVSFWESPFTVNTNKETYYQTDHDFVAGEGDSFYKENCNLQTNYFVLGMYFASLTEVKAIIENSEKWELIDYTFEGELVTGNNKYPSYAIPGMAKPNGLPIVRLKYNSDKTKALVFGVYPCNPNALSSVTINVLGKDFELLGGWADIFLIENLVVTTQPIVTCVPNVKWNLTEPVFCENNSTKVLLEVKDNCGNLVQFSRDGSTWTNANLNTQADTKNAVYMTIPSTDICHDIFYKVPSLNITSQWGCVKGLPSCNTQTVVECGTSEANPHECSEKSTDGTHHSYYDSLSNRVYGVLVSNKGQYKIYNDLWKDCTYLGTGLNNKRYVGYREPYTGSSLVSTRTREGCVEFVDGHCGDPRPISIVSIDFSQKNNLNVSQSHTGNVIDLTAFTFSKDLGNGGTNHGLWAFSVYGNLNNIMWKINDSSWRNTTFANNISVFNDPSSLGGIPKDFILELKTSDGLNSDKFICRSFTNKGHFTVTMTMTRLRDGKVFVSSYNGDINLPSYIKLSNGTKVNSVTNVGNCFVLNSLNQDEDVTLGFQETNLDWINIKLLNKNN
jgi:hypothetical protein